MYRCGWVYARVCVGVGGCTHVYVWVGGSGITLLALSQESQTHTNAQNLVFPRRMCSAGTHLSPKFQFFAFFTLPNIINISHALSLSPYNSSNTPHHALITRSQTAQFRTSPFTSPPRWRTPHRRRRTFRRVARHSRSRWRSSSAQRWQRNTTVNTLRPDNSTKLRAHARSSSSTIRCRLQTSSLRWGSPRSRMASALDR
jgi:hypothetical protein